MENYSDDDLIRQYTADLAIGRSEESVQAAIRDGYSKLEGKFKPPYRVVEIWAYGDNPFTEFRVVLKGGGS